MTPATAAPAATEFRARFPMLERTVHLASCSLGARSSAVDDSLTRMLDAMVAGGAAWSAFEEAAEGARRRFAALIGARPDEVALVPSASVGAYQVVSTLDLATRDGVVTTLAEFPSIAHVWLAQRARGARVAYTARPPADGTAAAVAGAYRAVVDERTALVSVPLVTYADGLLLPVAEVTRAAHAAGARVFVDAYQAAGVLPVDVGALGCDYLVAGSLKYLLGLPGVAFLYARGGVPAERDPTLTGWFGRVDPFAFDPRRCDFPATARRFETGTPAVPALYATNAGLDLLGALDPDAVAAHVRGLVELAAARLRAQGERVTLAAAAADRGAHLGLVDRHPADLAAWLAARSIAVSPRGPLVRIAFHYYNDVDDVDKLCAALRGFRSVRPVDDQLPHGEAPW